LTIAYLETTIIIPVIARLSNSVGAVREPPLHLRMSEDIKKGAKKPAAKKAAAKKPAAKKKK
jgi:hypothetical protein